MFSARTEQIITIYPSLSVSGKFIHILSRVSIGKKIPWHLRYVAEAHGICCLIILYDSGHKVRGAVPVLIGGKSAESAADNDFIR